MTNQTIEQAVEEICDFDFEGKLWTDKGFNEFKKVLTQTLQATIDTVLEGERERVKELLQDNIWPGELNEHTNRVLNNVKEALTPLNKE